ncbi:uncharacterized protein ACO6RY_10937 [Pungitius sinensis]
MDDMRSYNVNRETTPVLCHLRFTVLVHFVHTNKRQKPSVLPEQLSDPVGNRLVNAVEQLKGKGKWKPHKQNSMCAIRRFFTSWVYFKMSVLFTSDSTALNCPENLVQF